MIRLLISFLLLAPSTSFAMTPASFKNLMSQIRAEKYEKVEKFLNSEKESLKKDPEYFVVLLNFVLSKGYQSGLVIAKGEPQPGDFSVQSKDGEAVGFMGKREGYDAKLIADGISRTESSLQHFKSRLDIRFGIVTAAERIKRWDAVSRQLVETLKVSREIKNKWTWGPVGSMDGNPKEFMIENVLSRTSSLFHQETDSADQALTDISEALIQYYPELPYGYSNLGTLYLTKKEFSRAEKYLLQAQKVAPQDEIVQNSLAKLKEMRGR